MTYLRGDKFEDEEVDRKKKRGLCPAVGFYAGDAEPWRSIRGEFSGYGN